MAVYSPLFVYLTPASIPQVVAHIQKYLSENPIISDEETIAELIREYIAAHPELLAVSSVNGKTGTVVLTGSDININASSAVSVETQLQNLASMISSAGSDIDQIEDNISQIYTTIGTLQTNVETNASNISGLQTSVAGQGTRLATAESDIDSLESAQTAQGTRLNTAEGNISSLQTRMTQAEADINTNENNISNIQATVNTLNGDTQIITQNTFVSISDKISIRTYRENKNPLFSQFSVTFDITAALTNGEVLFTFPSQMIGNFFCIGCDSTGSVKHFQFNGLNVTSYFANSTGNYVGISFIGFYK